MQQAKAGLEAVYLSGWQVAADGNTSETMYPDQSLYAYDSVPTMVRRINNTFKRADEIQWSRGINPGDEGFIDYFLPIVADAEAGFGGVLNAFELMKNMIAAGAAGVHFEDQLAAAKKCGHMGGKVLVPTREAIEKLISARFAADVMGVPTLILARTDAEAANLITSDYDANDKPFLTGERTQEGFYRVKNGLEQSISRGVAYARTPTSSGAKPACPISASPANSLKPCRPPARASCCPTTARRPSTGRRTCPTRRSPPSRTSCPHWATSTSSSPWPASTSTGTTPSSSPTPTPAAKA
jgi:isocitrate lyase